MNKFFKFFTLLMIASILLCCSTMTNEEKQTILEENFKVSPLIEGVTYYHLYEVNSGIVKKISFINDEIMMYPLDSVTFSAEGLMEFTYGIEFFSKVLTLWHYDDEGNDIKDYEIEYFSNDSLCRLDSIYIEDLKKKQLYVYKFNHNNDGDILSISCIKCFYDYSSKYYYVDETRDFLIKETIKDKHGNWVSRTFIDDTGTTYNQKREIEYYKPPVLIPYDSEDKLYCLWNYEFNNKRLLMYNTIIDKWTLMEPIEVVEWDHTPVLKPKYYYGIQDYRLKGNRIYCKFDTGQCGLGLKAIAFEYFDLKEGEWHFITYGTEESEFVGDCIKADIAWIVKEGENYSDTEIADSIKWIELE